MNHATVHSIMCILRYGDSNHSFNDPMDTWNGFGYGCRACDWKYPDTEAPGAFDEEFATCQGGNPDTQRTPECETCAMFLDYAYQLYAESLNGRPPNERNKDQET